MNYFSPIYTVSTECQDCYKCIRQCPVKAIRVEKGHAQIIAEQCILCGTCVTHCPAHAKYIRDDLNRAKQLLTLREKVIVSLAPSFVSEFPEYTAESMVAALKHLGFWAVSETAVGADIVSKQIAQDLSDPKNTNKKLFLSSACPVTVEYIKKFFPEYAEYITDRASPLMAHSRYLKKIYGEDIGIVFIGPCIAKKREADVWKEIDVALTFEDLRKWLTEHPSLATNGNVIPAGVDTSFVPKRAAKGALYPVDGGMIAAIKKYNRLSEIRTMAIAGIDEVSVALQGLDVEKLQEPLFIELLACAGGCINGPGTQKGNSSVMKRVQLLDYAATASDVNKYESFDDLYGTLPVIGIKKTVHSPEEIRNALRSVGKYTPQDELNCASCGYDTCRSFAEAILDNRAEKTMCVSYMRKLAQKKANGLIRSIPSGVVVADKNLSIIECNYNFAKLLGDDVMDMYDAQPGLEGCNLDKIAGFAKYFSDVLLANGPEIVDREVKEGKKIFHITVFVIEKEEIAAAVVEDITLPQIQKSRVVSQAKKVINKNLAAVQKIAFLLGENAAETESILNSIIDSFDIAEGSN